jgi:eukaryotic-like serine/threonine-protein kinase
VAEGHAGSFNTRSEVEFYFVASDGTLLGVSRLDGRQVWSAPGRRLSARNLSQSASAVAAGTGGVLHAVASSDGAAKWSTDLRFDGAENCVTAATQAVFVACTPDWNVVAIDASTGAVRWRVSLRDSLSGLPTLIGTAVSGDTVYAAVRQLYSTTVGFAQAILFALSLTDGHLLAVFREGDYTDFVGYVATPRVVGRMLIVPHLFTNRITGIDRFTGRVVWRVNGDPGWAGFVGIPTVVDGVFYAASADRRVYAVEAATGSIRWKSDILEGSQELAAACGSVVVTWTGVNVRVLDRATGKYLGAILDDIPPGLEYAITSPPFTDGNELFVRSQKEYRKYTCR